MFEFIFLFFIVILFIILYWQHRSEKTFTQKVSKHFSKLFPSYNVKIISEGGIIGDPNIVANYKDETIQIKVLANVITVRHGKHSDQDMFMSLIIDKDFTNIITESQEPHEIKFKREGFWNRLLGGENVELGYPEFDNRLYIKAAHPNRAKQFLFSHLYIIEGISHNNDLETGTLNINTEKFFLKLRFEHANYKNAINVLNHFKTIMKNLLGEDSLRKQQKTKLGERTFIKPLQIDEEATQIEKLTASQQADFMVPAFEMLRYQAQSVTIEEQYCIVDTFLRLFDKLTFKWNESTLVAEAPVGINKDISCVVRLQRKKNIGFNWDFDNVDVKIEPKELEDNLDSQLEIGRYLSKFEGTKTPLLTLQVDKGQGKLRVEASTHPKNVQVMFDLIKSIDWFIDISFV